MQIWDGSDLRRASGRDSRWLRDLQASAAGAINFTARTKWNELMVKPFAHVEAVRIATLDVRVQIQDLASGRLRTIEQLGEHECTDSSTSLGRERDEVVDVQLPDRGCVRHHTPTGDADASITVVDRVIAQPLRVAVLVHGRKSRGSEVRP